MRKVLVRCLGLLLLVAAASAWGSEGFDDLAKLVKSGAGEEVILSYVESSKVAYDLTVDEILYLSDLGVSPKVISAIVQHGKEAREKGGAAVAAPAPAPAPRAEAPAPEGVAPVTGRPEPEAVAPVIGQPEHEAVAPLTGHPEPAGMAPEPPPAAPLAPAPEVVQETEVVTEAPPVVVAPPPDEVNVSFFYQALSPYGSWISLNGMWVWQPTVVIVDHSWRPYCDRGHWVYTDCGWCWRSDYSWGWAPFHYGRWVCSPACGWVWVPDTIWGPAWVSWRTCDTHYGWAPLPPAARYEPGVGFHYQNRNVGIDFSFGLGSRDFVFVPCDSFTQPGLNQYAVAPTHVTNIYNKTVIQNNYTYNDNRIINNGPPIDHVRHATGQDLKPVKLVDAPIQPGQPIKGGRVQNGTLGFYRPKVDPKVPETPPAVIAQQQANARRETIRTATQTRQETQRNAAETGRNPRVEPATARPNVREPERNTKLEAEQAARAQAQRDTAARQGASEAQRNTKLEAEQAARAQAERDTAAREAAGNARLETERAAREQAQRETVARSQAQRDTETRVRSAPETNVREAPVAVQPRAAPEPMVREQPRREAAPAPEIRIQPAPRPAPEAPRVESFRSGLERDGDNDKRR